MERYASGDTEAFAELYDLLAPRLLAMLRRKLRDPERSCDLLQEVMLRIHRFRSTFVAGSSVAPWAFAIAERVVLNDVRQRKRKPPLSSQNLTFMLPPGPETTPEQLAESAEFANRLEQQLHRLSPAQREVFDLVRRRGLSLAQTASALGITVGAAKVRLHRACGLLRVSLLEDSWP
jgi:RNA polymerase sigma-70 factor (ECF subfamily)